MTVETLDALRDVEMSRLQSVTIQDTTSHTHGVMGIFGRALRRMEVSPLAGPWVEINLVTDNASPEAIMVTFQASQQHHKAGPISTRTVQ